MSKVSFKYSKGDIVEFKDKEKDGKHKWVVTGFLDGDTIVSGYYIMELLDTSRRSSVINRTGTTLSWDIDDLHKRCYAGVRETFMDL